MLGALHFIFFVVGSILGAGCVLAACCGPFLFIAVCEARRARREAEREVERKIEAHYPVLQ
jgi:hypothetical protein